MAKVCSYPIDQLPGGETGVYEFLQRTGFRVEQNEIYREDILVGKVTDGTFFSETPDLELHVFSDSELEQMIDGLQVGESTDPE